VLGKCYIKDLRMASTTSDACQEITTHAYSLGHLLLVGSSTLVTLLPVALRLPPANLTRMAAQRRGFPRTWGILNIFLETGGGTNAQAQKLKHMGC